MREKYSWIQYKLHIIVLIIVVISTLIGVKEIKLTNNMVILIIPFIYSLILGLLVLAKPIKFIGKEQVKFSENFMVLLLGVLIAKLAVSCGQSIFTIFNFGPALILQQIGDLGTLIVIPLALILGFKRESIGMGTSICREPSLSIIGDIFGVKSDEFNGVLIILIIGSILGAIFINILTSVCISFLPIHPYAYAMASGVGSVSMSTASLTSLTGMFPSMATDLEALTACSNILSTVFGIYLTIFVSIPLAEVVYKYLNPILGKKEKSADYSHALEDNDNRSDVENNKFDFSLVDVNFTNIKKSFILLMIFSLITSFGTWLGLNDSFINIFVGMIIISVITIVGMIISAIIPYKVPSIVYISLIGILLVIPGVPTADLISYYVSSVDLTVICIVFMAYVGVAIGEDWQIFKKIGLKGIVITFFVIAGTFLGSALIAQLVLTLTNFV